MNVNWPIATPRSWGRGNQRRSRTDSLLPAMTTEAAESVGHVARLENQITKDNEMQAGSYSAQSQPSLKALIASNACAFTVDPVPHWPRRQRYARCAKHGQDPGSHCENCCVHYSEPGRQQREMPVDWSKGNIQAQTATTTSRTTTNKKLRIPRRNVISFARILFAVVAASPGAMSPWTTEKLAKIAGIIIEKYPQSCHDCSFAL